MPFFCFRKLACWVFYILFDNKTIDLYFLLRSLKIWFLHLERDIFFRFKAEVNISPFRSTGIENSVYWIRPYAAKRAADPDESKILSRGGKDALWFQVMGPWPGVEESVPAFSNLPIFQPNPIMYIWGLPKYSADH